MLLLIIHTPNVEQACEGIYANHPEAVDLRLVHNIVRDATDPGE